MLGIRTRQLWQLVVFVGAAASMPGCRNPKAAANVLRIGATAVPHEAMLREVQPMLAEAGITMKMVVMQDYVQPNLRVASGDLDANFFQTAAYFDDFKAHHSLNLVSAGSVHVEPFALYSKKHTSLQGLPKRAKVAVPSDASNQHRALILLARAGLVTLPATASPVLFGIRDIQNNPRHLQLMPVDAAMMPRMLYDADLAGINANFALAAGLRPATDGLVVESADATPYANIVAIREADATRPAVVQLMAALRSDAMRAFIDEHYQGAVLPTF